MAELVQPPNQAVTGFVCACLPYWLSAFVPVGRIFAYVKDRSHYDLLSVDKIHYSKGKTANRNSPQVFMKLAVNKRVPRQFIQGLFNARKEVVTQSGSFTFIGRVLLNDIEFSLWPNRERIRHLLG